MWIVSHITLYGFTMDIPYTRYGFTIGTTKPTYPYALSHVLYTHYPCIIHTLSMYLSISEDAEPMAQLPSITARDHHPAYII